MRGNPTGSLSSQRYALLLSLLARPRLVDMETKSRPCAARPPRPRDFGTYGGELL